VAVVRSGIVAGLDTHQMKADVRQPSSVTQRLTEADCIRVEIVSLDFALH
jgi:hypothetical protein